MNLMAGEDSLLVINTDGGARGNPGESGIGIVFQNNSMKKGFYFYTGVSTNNEAEYSALLKSLELAKKNNHLKIEVYSDSELVCHQVNGKYKVKSENLKKIYTKCLNLIKDFTYFSISHTPRINNKEADKLANMAMDLKKNGEIDLTVAPHLFNN